MSRFDVLHRLRTLIDERHISVYRLAKNSGVPQTTINTYFQKNRNPNIDTLEKLCDTLGITLSEFFQENDNQNPKH